MRYQIDRLWDQLKVIVRRLVDVENDTSAHAVEIAEIKGQLTSERAKRGWATRRHNAAIREQQRLRESIAQLAARVNALEAGGPVDDASVREVFEQTDELITRLH